MFEEEDKNDLGFARKYRSNTWKNYIGNEKVKNTVMTALAKGKRFQSYGFFGDSGCGKTTVARLLAKEYLCENRDDVNGACGVCEMCEQMDNYITTGKKDMLEGIITELDVGRAGGKDAITRAVEDMSVDNHPDTWTVWIFDECQGLSDTAQESLLKVFEEPLKNVLIILCSTDPQKLKHTLKNRLVQQLQIKKPTVDELTRYLASICTMEDVEHTLTGCKVVAEHSECTIRTALTELENVITLQGKVTESSVVEVYDTLVTSDFIKFYKLLLGTPVYTSTGELQKDQYGSIVTKKDIHGYVAFLYSIKDRFGFYDFVRKLKDFTIKSIYVYNHVQNTGFTENELKEIVDLFTLFTVEQIAVLLNKLLDLESGDTQLKLLNMIYSGINATNTQGIDTTNNASVGVPMIAHENEKEQRQSALSKSLRTKEERDKNNEEFDKQIQTTQSMDDLLSLFGGSTVKFN